MGWFWSWREELNLQPVVYKTTALPLSYASPLAVSQTCDGQSTEDGVTVPAIVSVILRVASFRSASDTIAYCR